MRREGGRGEEGRVRKEGGRRRKQGGREEGGLMGGRSMWSMWSMCVCKIET